MQSLDPFLKRSRWFWRFDQLFFNGQCERRQRREWGDVVLGQPTGIELAKGFVCQRAWSRRAIRELWKIQAVFGCIIRARRVDILIERPEAHGALGGDGKDGIVGNVAHDEGKRKRKKHQENE